MFEIGDSFDAENWELTKDYPNVLYHYTNADGALGILSSGEICENRGQTPKSMSGNFIVEYFPTNSINNYSMALD